MNTPGSLDFLVRLAIHRQNVKEKTRTVQKNSKNKMSNGKMVDKKTSNGEKRLKTKKRRIGNNNDERRSGRK